MMGESETERKLDWYRSAAEVLGTEVVHKFMIMPIAYYGPESSYRYARLAAHFARLVAGQDEKRSSTPELSEEHRELLLRCREVLSSFADQVVTHDRVYGPLVRDIDDALARWKCGA